jgi:adenylate cyclase
MFDSQSTVPLTEIQRLRGHVNEVAAALQSQQEILRTRGMNLPPGALQNLDHIDRDLKNLEKQLTDEETELSQLRALVETSAMINSSLDLDEVLTHAMDELIKLTRAERGYLMLRNPETSELELRLSREPETDRHATGTFQGSHTILNDVVSSGKPLLTENAYKDPRMQANKSVAHMVLRSVLCVPLNYKDQVTGALYVDNRLKAGVFTERELGVVEAFANQVAVAVANAQLFKEIQAYLLEVTELNQVMKNVFDSIGSGIITTDGSEIIRTYNPAASDILEHAAEVALGHPLTTVLPEDSRQYIQNVRERSRSQAFDTELDTPSKHKILNLRVSPLKDARKDTQGMAVVVDDLTAQREREDQFVILKRYLPPSLVDNIERIAGLDMGGERREMTCMFVDVRGFSTFPPGLRPQEVMGLLNEYLSVATACINRVNGVIDKYMGTEVMALFNTRLNEQPQDHALRAVEAALLMRDGFQKLYKTQKIKPEPHFYRVGIHSGWATTGNVGSHDRRDFTALGDTINLSHRLLENAGLGQIIISDSTLDYLRQSTDGSLAKFRFEERDPITVKGRQQATGRYEVFQS